MTFKLQGRRGHQAFHFAPAVFVNLERLIRKLLQDFERFATTMAAIFVKRHILLWMGKPRLPQGLTLSQL